MQVMQPASFNYFNQFREEDNSEVVETSIEKENPTYWGSLPFLMTFFKLFFLKVKVIYEYRNFST